MPTSFDADETPIVSFDPTVEVSPFALFRRLQDGHELTLIDCRAAPGPLSLKGARSHPGNDWVPEPTADVVLFDERGDAAVIEARRLQALGAARTRALFGGLELYEFSLDPDIVGAETFLVRQDGER